MRLSCAVPAETVAAQTLTYPIRGKKRTLNQRTNVGKAFDGELGDTILAVGCGTGADIGVARNEAFAHEALVLLVIITRKQSSNILSDV